MPTLYQVVYKCLVILGSTYQLVTMVEHHLLLCRVLLFVGQGDKLDLTLVGVMVTCSVLCNSSELDSYLCKNCLWYVTVSPPRPLDKPPQFGPCKLLDFELEMVGVS